MTSFLLTVLLVLLWAVPVEATCPKIPRRAAVLREFRKTHPCPSTGKTTGACPGWVMDHGLSLCLTGPEGDASWNIFWQAAEPAKRKDRLERKLCRLYPRSCPHVGD